MRIAIVLVGIGLLCVGSVSSQDAEYATTLVYQPVHSSDWINVPSASLLVPQERDQSNAGRQPTNRPLSEHLERFREQLPVYRVDKLGAIEDLFTGAVPARPENSMRIEAGKNLICRCPIEGLTRLSLTPPTADGLGPLPSTMVRYRYVSLVYDPDSVILESRVFEELTRLAKTFKVSATVSAAVRKRLEGATVLQMVLSSLKLVQAGGGDEPVSEEDALYRDVILDGYAAPGDGGVCRVIASGDRTVLLLTKQKLEQTKNGFVIVFEDSKPYYSVSIHLPMRSVGDSASADELRKVRERLLMVYRSVIECGLGVDKIRR
ncbi:MAG: hypothetical protein IID41_13135 [Planctomycetes bacterium]|nr:hypothetical protein [Planctomycetota bacterium]